MLVLDQKPLESPGGAAALGKHEESSDPPQEKLVCVCGPEHFRLENQATGLLVRPRGKSPNKCPYCRQLAAIENTKLLALDALYGVAPTLLLVLGTRTPTLDTKRFYRGREAVLKALKRRWPDVAYVALPEYTTGKAETSGGERRPHWNILLKGIPTECADQAREIARRIWCNHVDALPEYQYLEAIDSHEKVIQYVSDHFQKQSQAPPEGFKGHRLTKSQNYLWTDSTTAREMARDELRLERELWKAEQYYAAAGVELHDVYEAGIDVAADARKSALTTKNEKWKLVPYGERQLDKTDRVLYRCAEKGILDPLVPQDCLNPTNGRRSPRPSAKVDVSGAEGLHGKTARTCADGRTDAEAAEPPHRRTAPARAPALRGRPAAMDAPPHPAPVIAEGDPAPAREPTERPSDANHA